MSVTTTVTPATLAMFVLWACMILSLFVCLGTVLGIYVATWCGLLIKGKADEIQK